MTLFKNILSSLFVFLLLISPAFSYAVEPAPATPTSTATLVSEVDIRDARIMSQEGNTFNIAFSIVNGKGLQSGVKYGVQLIPETGKYIADEKAYDESVTLYENSTEKREIVYKAPSQLSGSYNLMLTSGNENNFPFGMALLGKVKLSPASKGVTIDNSSCFLQIEGEKASPKYTLTQYVDIDDEEILKLTCTATNTTDKALSLTPFFETKHYNVFGKPAQQSGGDYTPITFKKAEKKTFSIKLPRGTTPQFYDIKVSLVGADTSSNAVKANYIVRGISGILQKLSLDKDYYSMGDKGMVTVLWSASAGNFARSGVKYPVAPNVSFNAKITNKNGVSCASPIEQVLTRTGQDPQTIIEFKSKLSCINPKVSATLTDDKGNVLDQKEFSFTTSEGSMPKPMSSKSVLIIVMIVVAVVVITILMKKNRKS